MSRFLADNLLAVLVCNAVVVCNLAMTIVVKKVLESALILVEKASTTNAFMQFTKKSLLPKREMPANRTNTCLYGITIENRHFNCPQRQMPPCFEGCFLKNDLDMEKTCMRDLV
jgi:hypothetical protein